ncbi:MAG: GNAT family N-acetyltransferase [Thermodesulfobacteriota bacterium]
MSKNISKLVVPNDPAYIKGIISYCNEISRGIGFSEKEIEEIGIAVREVCINVITHAFEPHEDESFAITFEVLSYGIRIAVDEMGLPFSPRLVEEEKDAPGLHAIESNMDNVLFINRGKDGKELQLFKYLKGKHVEEFFTEDELKPYKSCEILSGDAKYTIRLMKPKEAIEVSRCVYRTYRYTYLNEDLYFPERIDAMNRDGSMISSVALTDEGKIIAHFALLPRPNGRAAEIGVAVVIPRYRGRGLMQLLLNHLIREAKKRGFIALFGNAFTMHVLSQRTNLKFGFKETAIELGAFPPMSLKPLTDRGFQGTGHVITFFKYLKAGEEYKVFLPPQHKDMLKGIYKNLGIKRSYGDPGESWAIPFAEESTIKVSIKSYHKTATIEIMSYGKDIERRMMAKRIELTNKEFNAIYLDLNLNDPLTAITCKKLENHGFFFSGLLPDYSNGDTLRLQYYNTDVDYNEIETSSPFAIELMDYIKVLDPRWRALNLER